ncbi:IS66 family transposase [Ruegeria sp. HKCCD8929]|uniref:IS66 family transposase n=1 Tax=Ruegeria sp. HKCCD8929 TaxID=2683006 RepID=UPI0020C570CF|nr:IS66 family transposase [Ruegeria sp. HKCCD8929]
MKKLRPFLDHGFLEIDNNSALRAMKSVAISRKPTSLSVLKVAEYPLPSLFFQCARAMNVRSFRARHGSRKTKLVNPGAKRVKFPV